MIKIVENNTNGKLGKVKFGGISILSGIQDSKISNLQNLKELSLGCHFIHFLFQNDVLKFFFEQMVAQWVQKASINCLKF